MAQDHACPFTVDLSFPGGASGKEPVCQCRRCKKSGFYPWVRKIPWRRVWQPTPVSCLENPIDRGAWRASPTWLKWLSTHSRTVGLVSRGFNSPNTQISNFLGFMISGKFWMARILLVPITSEFRLMGDKEVGKEPGFFPKSRISAQFPQRTLCCKEMRKVSAVSLGPEFRVSGAQCSAGFCLGTRHS